MAYYIRNGNTFHVTDEAAVDIQRSLPIGNYLIKEDPLSGQLYLEQIDNFKPIAKLYGKLPNYTDRILNTFIQRPNTTGAMFTGEKGSGKSLLAKEICIKGQEMNVPTIVINQPWYGDKFNKLIQDIEQEAIILFDEFEKVYFESTKQEAILTLLDGVFPTKKLFVMTCNDKWRIDQHMRNRPGRIFYMIDFKGLDADFIIEYCEDNLKNKEHISKIVNLASLFSEFNFDMLKALVEDMNRYDETPQEALSILNAKPEYEKGHGAKFDMDLITPCGVVIPRSFLEDSSLHSNPLSVSEINVYFAYEVTSGEGNTTKSSDSFDEVAPQRDTKQDQEMIALLKRYVDVEDGMTFTQDELVRVNGDTGTFEYLCKDTGMRLHLTRQQQAFYNYFSAL